MNITNIIRDIKYGALGWEGPKWWRRFICFIRRGHNWCEPECCGPMCLRCDILHPHAYDSDYWGSEYEP